MSSQTLMQSREQVKSQTLRDLLLRPLLPQKVRLPMIRSKQDRLAIRVKIQSAMETQSLLAPKMMRAKTRRSLETTVRREMVTLTAVSRGRRTLNRLEAQARAQAAVVPALTQQVRQTALKIKETIKMMNNKETMVLKEKETIAAVKQVRIMGPITNAGGGLCLTWLTRTLSSLTS